MKDINEIIYEKMNIKDISLDELKHYNIDDLDLSNIDIENELVKFKNKSVKKTLFKKVNFVYDTFVNEKELLVVGLSKLFKKYNLTENYLALWYCLDVMYIKDKDYVGIENYLGWLETYLLKHM